MRFRREQHVRTTREFELVRSEGKRRDCGAFLLHLREFTPAERGALRRLGVVASRRVGGAVVRNRAKRRLREIFRHQQEQLPANCDVVLTARSAIQRFDHDTLTRRFCAAVHQMGLEKSTTREAPKA